MASTSAGGVATALRRAGRKNLFDLLRVLPNSGVGSKVSRQQWQEGCFWEVTRIKIDPDGAHGKVWGKPYWMGDPKPIAHLDTRVTGPLKTCWEVRESNQKLIWQSEDWSAIVADLEAKVGSGAAGETAEEA